MPDSLKQFGLRMISGQDQSLAAKSARLAASIAEPFYAGVMAIRNTCYDCGIFHASDLGRPTISVGNITTGGTGKTPVVQWLAEQLRQAGHHPAILLRGYGKHSFSDEAQLLDQSLNNGLASKIQVMANPSRIEGAAQVLKAHPTVDVFILDDAFQHRKVRRNFNLVLISAAQPFGFEHVLPRGLLRESLRGLRRADAFLITRSSLVPAEELAEIDRHLRNSHAVVPIYHCDHQLAGIVHPILGEEVSIEAYDGERVFLTAAIGDPYSFAQQIERRGCRLVGTRWFDDHHAFTQADIISIDHTAKAADADVVLTTEKDWVKMKSSLPQASEVGISVVKLKIDFKNDDAAKLLQQIIASL